MPIVSKEFVAGVDGCKSGWIAIVYQYGRWDYSLHPNIEAFHLLYHEADSILIDMPIGLVAGGTEGRACDRLARKCLSPYRHSSIFTPPCRPALYADLPEASAVNYQHTGKKLSRQSINIIPKIREVDEFLLQLPSAQQGCYEEAHPELIFYGLNHLQALPASKKTKEGIQDRLLLLTRYFPYMKELYLKILGQTKRKEVLPDDIVDAMSLAAAAVLKKRSPKNWQQFPSPTVYDGKGLPMQLGYYTSQH